MVTKDMMHIALPSCPLALAISSVMLAPLSTHSIADTSIRTDSLVVIGQATAGVDSLVTDEQIERIHADSLADIFKSNASITAGGPIGMGQKIYLRNIGEDQLNISVDGAEQAGSVFHHTGRVAIEPELIKQVEVEAGAGSALTGLGALGGSVKFVTKDPEDLLQPGEQLGGLLKTSFADNSDRFKNTATLFGQTVDGSLGGIVSFSDSRANNSSDAEGNDLPGTESDKTLGYLKLTGNFDNSSISLSHEAINEKGMVLYKPELIAGPKNLAEPTEAHRKTTILNYDYTPVQQELINLSFNLYQTQSEQSREFKGTEYSGHTKSLGLTIKNTSHLDSHKIAYGINYRDDESYLHDVDFASSSFIEKGTVKAIFVQDVIQISQQLTVAAGLRFDDYELNDVNGLTLNDSGLSPNLSANYEIRPGLSLSAGYAEAFRGPEIKDAFKLSSYSNDADLKAEKAHNFELGMDLSHGSFDFGAGLYHSRIANPIAGATPWSKVAINLEDDIVTRGYYLRAGYAKGPWEISADINIADTEFDDQTVTRYVYSSGATSIGDTLALDVNYQARPNLKLGWTAEFVRGMESFEINVAGEQLNVKKPGYAVHDVYARWLPTGRDTFVIGLSINNLFDKQYLSHASVEDLTANPGYSIISGSPEAGRDIRLSAKVRF